MKPVLFTDQDRLCLGLPEQPEASTLSVDFLDPALQHRVRNGTGGESVVKATGNRPRNAEAHPGPHRLSELNPEHHLIDATCGLGTDAFILALAGWQVTMLEQSPLIHALLEDGLKRASEAASAQNNTAVASALARMCLLPAGDSRQILATLPPAAVIYLDPMFPERDKTARVKKNRYLLQQLHGEEADGTDLLKLALNHGRKIVVKRPAHAEPLDGLKPSGSINGKTARFDIYAGRAQIRSKADGE